MSPRTGRPKIADPKSVEVKVRFHEQTNNDLLDYCKKHDITRVDAIRKGVELLLSQDKK